MRQKEASCELKSKFCEKTCGIGSGNGLQVTNKSYKHVDQRITANGKVALAAILHRETNQLLEQQNETQNVKTYSKAGAGHNLMRKFWLTRGKSDKRKRSSSIDDAVESIASSHSETSASNKDDRFEAQSQDNKQDEAKQHHHQQVIEFKFELIVDADEAAANQNRLGETEQKFGACLSELTESFASEANDVCLLSLRSEGVISANEQKAARTNNDSYVTRLAAETARNTLKLLASEREKLNNQLERQDYSISISANLLLSSVLKGKQVDQLDDDEPTQLDREPRVRLVDLLDQDDFECRNELQVESCLSLINNRLASLESEICKHLSCLLLSLKLTKQINGGSFSNRMCLISLDSNWIELRPIFERVFNGRALAYLKERSSNTPQVAMAPEVRLLDAEWLIYKQLSSALIRTLVLANVYKPNTSGALIDTNLRSMMEQNLITLDFANSIQANANSRARRRQHLLLKNHLASSSASIFGGSIASEVGQKISSDIRLRNKSAYGDQQHRHNRKRRHQNQQHSLNSTSRKPLRPRRRRLSEFGSGELNIFARANSSLHGEQATSWRCNDEFGTNRLRAPYFRQLPQSGSTASNSTSGGSFAINQTVTTSNLSDDSESLTSANAQSCFTSYSYRGKETAFRKQPLDRARLALLSDLRSNKTQEIELRYLKNKHLPRKQQQLLALQSTRKPELIQIDCQPIERPKPLALLLGSDGSEYTANGSQHSDNASELDDLRLCSPAPPSEMAEPLKQLKLEQFLNQLTNIIAPIKQQQACDNEIAPELTTLTYLSQLGSNQDDTLDDDEDCDSHSSVLEHLSSLALGSNTRRMAQATSQPDEFPSPPPPIPADELEVSTIDERGPVSGLLSRLLNGTQPSGNGSEAKSEKESRVSLRGQQINSTTSLEDKLKAMAAVQSLSS